MKPDGSLADGCRASCMLAKGKPHKPLVRSTAAFYLHPMIGTLTLSEINVYPIKSLRGISVTHARVKQKGLEFDRRWMLIDANSQAMTQRAYPQLAFFVPEIHDGTLRICYTPHQDFIDFPVDSREGDSMPASIWNDVVSIVEVSSPVSAWFSAKLGMSCRLVAFPEPNARPIDPRYARPDANVSLADAYPFLLIGQPSLDDLNSRLVEPVPMNRFRPNFVVSGAAPFAEDDWKTVSIGGVSFAVVKPCDRCVMTTIDQDTARKGTEPLRTLASYRRRDNGVFFGQNLIGLAEGEIKLGATVIPL